MYNEIYERLEKIKIENLMLVLFIVAVIVDLAANDKLKQDILTGDTNYNESAKQSFVFSGIILVFVFSYYAYRNYIKLHETCLNDKNYKNIYLRFLGSLLIVIGSLLILNYYIKMDKI